MPCYPYICSCGHTSDVFKPMSKYRDSEFCPQCGKEMQRDFNTGDSCASGNTAYHKPIEMFSIAPSTPDEMVDLRRKLPDTKFTKQGVPLAHTRAEKLAILGACSCEEKS